MLLKCGTPYASKFGKLSSGHRTAKRQFSFQSQKMAMPKNIQITRQLCSFHMLARLCTESFKLGFGSMWIVNLKFTEERAGFRKDRGTRDQIANVCWIIEKARESQKNIYFCFIDYTNAFVSEQTVENSSRDRNTKPPYLPPEKSVCRSRSNS